MTHDIVIYKADSVEDLILKDLIDRGLSPAGIQFKLKTIITEEEHTGKIIEETVFDRVHVRMNRPKKEVKLLANFRTRKSDYGNDL